MKTLYIDCGMGAAGDMLSASLLEHFPDPEKKVEELNNLHIPHIQFIREHVTKCGIIGTHLSVLIHGEEESSHSHSHSHEHEHHHHKMQDISSIIEKLPVTLEVKENVLSVYRMIADAESHVHGVPAEEIHFHEVGNLDAIADITAFCYLMEQLKPEKVVVSPIHVGSGQVHCAHGILPVPAPATARLLQGCPIYGGNIRGELCTPTGAALLKIFADEFGEMPVMKVSSIGYGMGKKDFEAANCVRTLLGETEDTQDVMFELNCNVDDMTAEQIGFALERFFEAGAVEAFTIPINMKKSRPGTLIRVICHPTLKDDMIRTIFLHTSTAGIREAKIRRSVLKRSITPVSTSYGIIHRKDYSGYGVSRSKYEYDDLARIAAREQISIEELLHSI